MTEQAQEAKKEALIVMKLDALEAFSNPETVISIGISLIAHDASDNPDPSIGLLFIVETQNDESDAHSVANCKIMRRKKSFFSQLDPTQGLSPFIINTTRAYVALSGTTEFLVSGVEFFYLVLKRLTLSKMAEFKGYIERMGNGDVLGCFSNGDTEEWRRGNILEIMVNLLPDE